MIDPIVEKLRQELLDRSEQGIRKYRVTLARDDLSAYDWLQHLKEELLDAALYATRLQQTEGDKMSATTEPNSDHRIFLRKAVRALGSDPYPLRSVAVLMELPPNGDDVALRDVSGVLGLSGPVMTRICDRLVADALVERTHRPGNRRTIYIALTPLGQRFIRTSLL